MAAAFVKLRGILPSADLGRIVESRPSILLVWTSRYCPPRHPTHFEPSFLEFNGILQRGEQYLPGPFIDTHLEPSVLELYGIL